MPVLLSVCKLRVHIRNLTSVINFKSYMYTIPGLHTLLYYKGCVILSVCKLRIHIISLTNVINFKSYNLPGLHSFILWNVLSS